MMALKLYSKTGATRLEFSPSSSDKQSERIMGEASISLSFSLPTAIEILMGDYVDYEGRKYVVLANYTPTKKSTREYQYSLSLYTIESTLASVKVLKPASEHQELNFSYDARPHEHIQLIVDNANRAGLGSWRVGTVLSAGSVNIEYNNKYCLEALNDIAEAYNSEWWIENGVINLIKREHGSPIRLAYQEGLTSLYASAAREKPITRLYPLGSTRNIDTSKYGSSRLHLPRNARYIERNTHLGLIEASEEASFSHIYPRYTGVVSSVRTEDRRSPEGKPYKVYYIKDNDIPFNANLYELQGLTKHIVFQSGELNGRDFEANYLTNTKEWEIITQFPYEGTQLPREPLIPKAGDKYIPYNFRMPEEYISRAEEELLTEANKYLDKVSIDNTIYKASTDYTYLLEQGINLGLGQRISLHDVDLFPSTAGEHQTRIIAISRSLLIPQQMEIECSATIERGRIEQMESGLDKMRAAYHRVEATMPSILRSNDSTDPSEDNVLSAIRSIKAIQRTALRKDTHDRTSYSLGSNEHVPGIVGWLLTPEGDLDLRNLKVSGTLEVDELRKNRISIQEGEHYFSSGNAIVEEVLEGDKMRVKGEQGEVSSLIAGDYVIGKWTNISGSIEVCKIKITAVNGLLLSYTLAPNTSIRPRVGMHLAQMGHDTDTRRQRASVVRANAIIQYAGVKGWEILPQHITAVMGDLEGFSFEPFGALMGSGVYINNAYITGTITQKSADGHSTRPLPFYKGEWTATSIAHTGDQYLYAGHKWTYQGVTPTTTAPSVAANWLDDGEEAKSLMNSLSIGGRNLVRRFNEIGPDGYRLGSWLFTKPEQWQAGLEYTLSFNLGTTHSDPLVWLYVDKYDRAVARIYPQEEPQRGDDDLFYGRYTLTFRPTQEDINKGRPRDGWDGFRLYLGHSNGKNAKDTKAKIDKLKLEKGNKATDYTPAPEEIDANILSAEERAKQYALEGDRTLKTQLEDEMSVNDYLRQAIAKGTKQEAGKIDTGLVLTEVLGVKDRDGLVRSFLSGDTAYPAFAAGVDHFGENNQSSRVMITHDGDVILGQMRMLGDAGVISFVPMAGGTPYLNIGGSPKAINDMVSGQFSGTDRQSEKVVRSYYGEDETDEIVLIDNFRINKSGTSIRISGSMTVNAQSSRIVDMHNLEVGELPSRHNSTLKRNGEGYTNIAASIILYYRTSETGQYNQVRSWYRTAYSYWDGNYHMGYEEYKSGEQRLDIAESIPGMQQGYYKLALAIKHNGSEEAHSNSDVTAQMAMTTESGEREIHLSSQALYAIFGSRRFFHVDENAVTIKHKLDIFGETNMPGILAAGKVTKWGTIDNVYGAKVKENGRDRARVERQGDNSYKVYHRIGHSNYTVQITPFDTRDAGSILEVASTYFRCCFYGTTDNNRYQHEFCYTCIGNNQ